MALADEWIGTSIPADVAADPMTQSLTVAQVRNGYAIRAARAVRGATGPKLALSGMTAMLGLCLLMVAPPVTSLGVIGLWVWPALGTYLCLAAVAWLCQLSWTQRELHVDHSNRVLKVVRRGLRLSGQSTQTIRFEEMRKVDLVDGLKATDMQASKMNWNMGRIDVTWRKSKVTPTITGDLAELELLASRLRRDVGLS